jgi:methionyl-tRNA synthetase
MFLQKLDPAELSLGYEVHCRGVEPWKGTAECPLYTSVCVVRPGETARNHKHQEHEAFLVARGRGRMTVDGESHEMGPGDVVYMPPFAAHELKNLDPEEDLIFYGLLWERLDEVASYNEALTQPQEAAPTRITVAPPVAGAGSVDIAALWADVYARCARARGSAVAVPSTPEAVSSEAVQGWLRELVKSGAVVPRTGVLLHCAQCQEDLVGDRVAGLCPHCEAGSSGDFCRTCARPHEGADLLDPRCQTCGKTPERRSQERLVFPLAPQGSAVRDALRGIAMSSHADALWAASSTAGLPEVSVTHGGPQGMEAAVPGFEGQRLRPWFVEAAGYLLAPREAAEAEARGVHFCAFSQAFLPVVLLPALAAAWKGEIPAGLLPAALVVHEGYDFAQPATDLPVERLRFYLCWDAPEAEPGSFPGEALEAAVYQGLVEGWEAWLKDLGGRLMEDFDGILPGTGGWNLSQERFYKRLRDTVTEAAEAYDPPAFSPRRVTRLLGELVRAAQQFSTAEGHWRGIQSRFEEQRTALALEALAAKVLAQVAAPILPEFSARLWRALGYDGTPEEHGWEAIPDFVPGGRDLSGLDPGPDGSYFS